MRNLKVNQSRSRFGKIYNLMFLIVQIQKINGGKFEFILLKIRTAKDRAKIVIDQMYTLTIYGL